MRGRPSLYNNCISMYPECGWTHGILTVVSDYAIARLSKASTAVQFALLNISCYTVAAEFLVIAVHVNVFHQFSPLIL